MDRAFSVNTQKTVQYQLNCKKGTDYVFLFCLIAF